MVRGLRACSVLLLAGPLGVSAEEGPLFPSIAVASEPRRPPAWVFSLRFQETWYNNVRFTAPASTSDFVSQPEAGLTRRWNARRASIDVLGGGALIFFRERSQRNRFTYNVGAAGDLRLRRRGNLNWSGSTRATYLFDSLSLDGEGLPLPLVFTRIDSGTAGLQLPVGSQTFDADAQYRRVVFGSPSLGDVSQLGGGVALGRRLGRTDSVSGSLRYTRSTSQARAGEVYSVQAAWSRPLTRQLTGRVGAGVSRFRTVSGSSQRQAFTGGASLAGEFRRARLTAEYGRSVSHAIGLGRDRISDRFRVSGSRALTRKLSSQVQLQYAVSHDPDASFRFTSTDGSAGLGYSLMRSLALSGTYSLRRIDSSQPSGDISSERWNASVAYNRSWR